MNSGVNVVGSTTAFTTMYGHTGIGCTGATFDISSTGTGGGTVTIGSTGAGNVTLGQSSGTGVTTVNSLVTNISTTGTTTVNIGNTGTSSPSGTVNVGTNSSTIAIGSSTATTTNIKSATINIQNHDSSSGNVNIKNGTLADGQVNIANTSGTVTTNIGAGTGTGEVKIGNPANTTSLKSVTLNIQNDATTGGTVNIKSNESSSGNVNIKNGDSAIGQVNIANTSGTVTTNIGAGTGTGTITIGNNNATSGGNTINLNSGLVNINSTTGSTNIYGGTNVGRNTETLVNTYIEMFSGSPNAIIDFHSAGVVNNDFDCRITSFSGSSSTDPSLWNGKGLLELTASTIQIDGTLAMKTGNNITLAPSTGYVAPTVGQLGYTLNQTTVSNGSGISSGVTYVYSPSTATSVNVLAGGVYMATIYSYITIGTKPFTGNVASDMGICYYGGVTPPAGGSGVVAPSEFQYPQNNTYTSYNNDRIFNNGTIIFTVPAGNTNYYFAYSNIAFGSTSGGIITPSVLFKYLVKIA